MGDLVLAVAPVGPWGQGEDNPVTPDEIARQVYRCYQEGAAYVHLHVRDACGRLTDDPATFNRTVELIRQKCDIVISGSTGGPSNLTRSQRCAAVLQPWVETASLNMGSCNLFDGVYVNSPEDIKYWAREMKAAGVKPEFEVFEAGMVSAIPLLVEEGLATEPFICNLSLGFPGAMPATAKNLIFMSELLPENSLWGLVTHGTTDLRMTATAMCLGASMVRCGFEDGHRISPTRVAADNAELVARVARLARSIGREPVSPSECRRVFGIEAKATKEP